MEELIKKITLEQAIDTVQAACDNAPCQTKRDRIAIDVCVEVLRRLAAEKAKKPT